LNQPNVTYNPKEDERCVWSLRWEKHMKPLKGLKNNT
jgi:hypothetical protein